MWWKKMKKKTDKHVPTTQERLEQAREARKQIARPQKQTKTPSTVSTSMSSLVGSGISLADIRKLVDNWDDSERQWRERRGERKTGRTFQEAMTEIFKGSPEVATLRPDDQYKLWRQIQDKQMQSIWYDQYGPGQVITVPTISALGSGTGSAAKARPKPKAPPRPKFKVGDRVKAVAATYAWDTVNEGDIGTVVKATDSGDFIVDFPNRANWRADPDDLKKVKIDTPSKVDFDKVFLADDKKKSILDAIKQIDHHKLIFDTWGFGDKFEKGTAVSMLFYGPPGTGKTMIAQAIADKYDKKLKVISTAEIESSEPGQAERNLKAYFEGTKDDTVLLFDECDSLIHDRAKVGMILAAQINALLMGLEKFKGIVIFTTNRLYSLDPAFERRLSLKVEFEMPDAKLREQIWKNMFPKKAPLAKNIDWKRIASVEIAGGNIKNVVLRCARMAANSKEKKITNAVLVKALEEELISMYAFKDAVESNSLPGLVGGDYTIRKGI